MATGEDTGVSEVAERYALALLDLADEKKELDSVAEDLRGVKQLIDESADLRRMIRSPVFSRDQQSAAMASILGKAGVGDITRRFVLLVARNRRLHELASMIRGYLSELARRRGEMTAYVTSARALNEAQQGALVEALRAKVGAKVRMLVTSNDVLHAWWVPELAIKKDAIPGIVNETWFRATETGTYRGQCAELCGKDHGYMPIVVEVVEPEEFVAWVEANDGSTEKLADNQ